MNRRRAFTIVELLVATGVSVVLSGIIYTIGSEALASFARNISINRSYSDARLSLERIGNALQSAGHKPILVDNTGVALPDGTTQGAGIRFYRYGFSPTYAIPSGTSSTKTLAVTVAVGQNVPDEGDLVVIPQIGFQGSATDVSCSLPDDSINKSGASVTATITFAATVTSGCVPATTTATNFTSASYSCQIYRQVAFVAVPPAAGVTAGVTQLRYYPHAMSASSTGTACGGLAANNSATAFNTPANYKVIASLPLNGTNAQIQPFQLLSANAPTVTITLCAEGPDYNKRGLNTANTFSQMRTSLGSRLPPRTLRAPF